MSASDARTASLGWMARGACQGEDPELFFPIAVQGPALHQVSAAKAVCRRCAVRAVCFSFGLENSQDGIWGGTTPEERRAIRQPSSPPPAARRHRQGQPVGRTVNAQLDEERGRPIRATAVR